MIKITIILFVLYFCSFILVCGEKNILPNFRSRVFLTPWSWSWSRSRLKKNQEPELEPLGKKIKSRSWSSLKKSQEPEPLKNVPAPQPCQ